MRKEQDQNLGIRSSDVIIVITKCGFLRRVKQEPSRSENALSQQGKGDGLGFYFDYRVGLLTLGQAYMV